MSYKYEEVVELMKKCRKDNFKRPVWLRVLMVAGIIGALCCGVGITVIDFFRDYLSNIAYTVILWIAVIGFLVVVAFPISSGVWSSSRRTKGNEEIDKFLKGLKRELHKIDIKAKEDIIALQTEIKQSIEQSDKQWAKILSIGKWAFTIICIKPTGSLLSAILSSMAEDTSMNVVSLLSAITRYNLFPKLLVIGILFVIEIITLSCVVDSIRKSFGPYSQKREVYNRLEDMKYLHIEDMKHIQIN